MPEMIRTWIVPQSATLPELRFQIREPPLTGDNIGLKTWGTAFAIVKILEEIGRLCLGYEDSVADPFTKNQSRLSVLELGSGTGLVGIAAAAIWGATVVLTDLPEIKDNLLFNIQRNADLVNSMRGEIIGDVLDWKDQKRFGGSQSAQFEVWSQTSFSLMDLLNCD
jgi:hypothetical protein